MTLLAFEPNKNGFLFGYTLNLHYILSVTEYRLRLGNKNMRAYFVFLSTCTIFCP